LTCKKFSKKLARMDGDVTALEHKLEQVLARFRELREQNRSLHGRVQDLEGANGSLADRMQAARLRLEALMDRLPEE
jgi:cell division protein ZapB